MIALKLIYSVIKEESRDVLYNIKKAYMGTDAPMVSFIKMYLIKHKEFPAIEVVEDKFKIELPTNKGKASHWLEELKEKYKSKVIDNAIRSLAKDKGNGVQHLQQALLEIASEEERDVVAYNEAATKRIEEYQERVKAGGVTYLSTGSPELDEFTYGLRPGDFWLLAGYEKSGKSFRMLRMANRIDKIISKYFPNDDRGILFVSCEVDKSEFHGRLDCINAKIPYDKFESGQLSPKQETKLYNWLKKAERLHKNGKSRLTIVDDLTNINQVETYIDLYNPAVMFIDSAHILAESFEYRELLKMSANFKNKARVSKVPIIASTHTNLKEGDGLDKINGKAFANFRAGRDPDFAFVMWADEEMAIRDERGIYAYSVRRAEKFIEIFSTNWNNMSENLIAMQSYTDYVSDSGDEDDSLY